MVALAIALVGCGGQGMVPEAVADRALNAPLATVPTVVIAHARGTATVPARPLRVVTLTVEATDTALSLGVVPVGMIALPEDDRYGRWLRDRAGSAAPVGTELRPSLEAIVALQPDLILGSNVRHGTIYERLAAIAPTVLSETLGAAWRNNVLLYGKALGRADGADQLLDRWHTQAQALRDRLGPTPPSLSFIRFLPGNVRLYLGQSFSGTIFQAVGLNGPAQERPDRFADILSLEALDRVEADFLIYAIDAVGHHRQGDRQTTWLNHPLWQRLEVVRRGQTRGLADSIWAVGCGPQAATFALADLGQWLVGRAALGEPP
ncbi:MAG: iron-siderophore ABC transporter substrate-binding protein [Cyanophyceae cyanobacterium]